MGSGKGQAKRMKTKTAVAPTPGYVLYSEDFGDGPLYMPEEFVANKANLEDQFFPNFVKNFLEVEDNSVKEMLTLNEYYLRSNEVPNDEQLGYILTEALKDIMLSGDVTYVKEMDPKKVKVFAQTNPLTKTVNTIVTYENNHPNHPGTFHASKPYPLTIPAIPERLKSMTPTGSLFDFQFISIFKSFFEEEPLIYSEEQVKQLLDDETKLNKDRLGYEYI